MQLYRLMRMLHFYLHLQLEDTYLNIHILNRMAEWSQKCKKVPWQPPGYVFRIVWPILYALYITLIILERNNPVSMFYLLLGLLLNLFWVPFYIYNVRLALVLLLAMIAVGVKTFFVLSLSDALNNNKISRSLLFAPYLAWICFASTLNAYLAVSCEK